jgi:hypothetical protein
MQSQYPKGGDRRLAIELLKTTRRTYKEIEKITGVPTGSLGALALKHRPESLRNKPGIEYGNEITAPTPIFNETESGISSIEPPNEDAISSQNGLVRNVSFTFSAISKDPISKEQVLKEIQDLTDFVANSPNKDFTFLFNIVVKGS